jgi:ADP-ribose pyrophosphatase YjhB (NUDIX family)
VGQLLAKAAASHLRLEVDGGPPLVLERGPVELAAKARTIKLSLSTGAPLAGVRLRAGQAQVEWSTPLSPLETRFLSRNGRPHPVPPHELPETGLSTDLHAHFSGCPRAADLVRLGAEFEVDYPVALLASAGVHVDSSAEKVSLASLSPRALETLGRALHIPVDRQVTFADLRRIYGHRSPLMKASSLWVPLCWQVARDYAAMGCTYAELSFATVVRSRNLGPVYQALPDIERETGVRLRFLAAMGRNDDPEWDDDYTLRLAQLADCPFIVGVDFLGHEVNSTRRIAPWIRRVAQWADTSRPGYVIRVHAGENPAHPENIRVALEAVQGCDVHVRIGHGLYGLDDRTLTLMRQCRAVVEFNLNSNLALNNIQHCGELPLRRYLDAGIDVVLGTDGYGIYQSSLRNEARAAWLAGLDAGALSQIVESEGRYLARRQDRDRGISWDGWVPPEELAPVHFTPEATAARVARREARDAALLTAFDEMGVEVMTEVETLDDFLRGQSLCVSFAGAWRKSWPAMPEAWRSTVLNCVDEILGALEPAGTLVISGGTQYGLEAEVQRRAQARGLAVLGVLVREIAPEAIDPSLTHAWIAGERLYDKAAALYGAMSRHDGWCLFFGGGNVVGDEIQCAENLRLRILLMAGPPGASTEHAKMRPHRAFVGAQEVVMALRGRTTWGSDIRTLRHAGPNHAVDAVVLRRNPETYLLEVLLVHRGQARSAEPGRWSLPGGFIPTDARLGEPWTQGRESAPEAAVREVCDETGLDLRPWTSSLVPVGVREGGGRDPRDTEERWVRSHVFRITLPEFLGPVPLAAGSEAKAARWIPADQLPWNLAFDHADIIRGVVSNLT